MVTRLVRVRAVFSTLSIKSSTSLESGLPLPMLLDSSDDRSDSVVMNSWSGGATLAASFRFVCRPRENGCKDGCDDESSVIGWRVGVGEWNMCSCIRSTIRLNRREEPVQSIGQEQST